MTALTTVISAEIALFSSALLVLVGYQLLTGQINTSGMLSDKTTRELSPARVQMLVATIFAAGFWLIKLLDATPSNQMPDVPQDVLLLLGGSHTLYLGSKSLPLFSQR